MVLLSLGTSLIDQNVKACLAAVRSGMANKLKKSNSALVLKVHDTIQSELDELKEKVESFVEGHLKRAVQLVQQALLIIIQEGVGMRNVSTVTNAAKWHVEMPMAAMNLLQQAELNASLVFYDKKNIKPIHRIESLKLQLFCALELQHNNPQSCLQAMELIISLIVGDVDLKTAVFKIVIGNKDVVIAMKRFYVEFRYVLWTLSSIWSTDADFSSIIAHFNTIFLSEEIFFINETTISDGIVLVGAKQGRRVLVTNHTNCRHAKNVDALLSIDGHQKDNALATSSNNQATNSTFQPLFILTMSNSEDFEVTFDTNVTCHVEYRYDKGKKFGAKSIQLEVRFQGKRQAVISEKFDFIKHIGEPAYIKECNIVCVHQVVGNHEKILIDIEAQSHSKQVVFRVQCNQAGKLKFKGVTCCFNSENDHVVRWSNKFQRYEVIEGLKGNPTDIVVYCVDANENNLYDKYTFNSDVTPFLRKNNLSLMKILVIDDDILCIVNPNHSYDSLGDTKKAKELMKGH